MKAQSIYICLFLLCISCSKDDDGRVLSDLNDITSFSINEQQGIIDNKIITLKLDTGTDITALTPVIEHTGASIAPANGTTQDFTNPVVYTVVAENGNTQEFTVIVTIIEPEPSDLNDITSFSINEQQGTIDNKTITLELAAGTDITALTLVIEHTGVSIDPENGSTQDFTNPLVYTVVSENGDTQEFTVIVTITEPSDLNDITSFSINEQQGIIDTNTITLEFDTGTDITALTPIIEHTGVSIAPENGSTQDFTNPVVYTVVAENGDTQEFTVTVTVGLGTATGIEFITTWSAGEITIPTNPDFTYNYNVDWDNDGVVDESGITGDVTHIFDADEEHTIRITGTFPSIQFDNNTNTGQNEADKIISVDQWGTGTWLSMDRAFKDCTNLKVLATDIPDLSSVTSLIFMFAEASIVNPDVSNWDISNVTNLTGMFSGASLANPDVSKWDTGNVTRLTLMFTFAPLANPDISNWNISKVTRAGSMFSSESALSTENYDKLLISFANQTRQNGVPFDAPGTTFCSDEATAARATLISESNWDISDGGRDVQCE